MNRIVIDLDGTLTFDEPEVPYKSKKPRRDVIAKLHQYKQQGFEIVVLTARNMRTYSGNVGKINVHTLPTILEWLQANEVPFDEVVVGKPWSGYMGFYVDDRAVRPDEFVNLTPAELEALVGKKPSD